MTDSPEPRSAADRNLLFGILALQMDFISRDALIAAMHAWVLDKHKSLGQILLDQGNLAVDRRNLLEALVQEHLALHDNDPEKSLAALPAAADVASSLQELGDGDVQASLAHITAFMSPEQAAGQLDRFGPASDIYSLGATLYVLLTAKPPFAETDVALVKETGSLVAWRNARYRQRTGPLEESERSCCFSV